MCVYVNIGHCVCFRIRECIYMPGLDLRNEKVIRNFCEIATHFGKVIRNCKSLFATYSHFYIMYIICVLKRGKKVFLRYYLKSDSLKVNSIQFCNSLGQSDSQLPQK